MTESIHPIIASIEHTLLTPEATPGQIDALCDEAVRFGFHGVCVHPVYVERAARRIESGRSLGEVRRPVVVSVAGFPLGASVTATKADEAARAMDDGATEVDMVAWIGGLIDGDLTRVRADIEAVARAVHGHPGGVLKVILELGALSAEQAMLGCRCCAEGEADFVKTSTGMHKGGGATIKQVERLHRLASPMGVKAAGGIRTAAQALAMARAGAARIGTSSGAAIASELLARRG
jgi:deoxyribose-phosphate aldolase